MQLTVEVHTSAQMTAFTCRGKIAQGAESDYLFDLITRPDNRDVFVDLQGIREFGFSGVLTILACQEYFSSQQRCLLFRLPAPLAVVVNNARGQVFLVFSDQTHFEFYPVGNPVNWNGAVDRGGLDKVLAYIRKKEGDESIGVFR